MEIRGVPKSRRDTTVGINGLDLVPAVARKGVQIVDDSDKYTIEKLQKCRAVVFVGGANPIKAESWTDIMEKAYKALSVPSQH